MPSEPLVVEGRPGPREAQYLVVAGGKLTWEGVLRFEQALQGSEAPTTIVDLTQVSLVDSAGLGAIVRAYVSHIRAGRRLVLVGVNQRVGMLLEMSGLNPVLTTFGSLEDAQAALP